MEGRRKLGYVPGLDGLRGVAITAVVSYHAFGYPRGGWIGVQLFFVLSGFLITTLLLEEHAATGTIRLGRFYVRRARRLLPALVLLLAGFLALGGSPGQVARWGFYGGNVYEAFWPAASVHLDGLNHLWSLAQEEQFYLAWPALLLAVRRTRHAAETLLALAVALMAYRIVLAHLGASNARIYFAPDTNLDALLLGAALAFHRPIAVSRRLLVVATTILAFVLATTASVAMTDAYGMPFIELSALILVAAIVTGSLRLPRPLVWLGGISYSLYLWHDVVLWKMHWHHPILGVAISIAAAYASTTWIEQPLRRRRLTASTEPQPVTA